MRERVRYVPALLLAVGALLGARVRHLAPQPLRAPLVAVPAEFEGALAEQRTISVEERRVAGAASAVLFDYVRDSSTALSVYVGYYDSQTQGRSIHSPRNCLPGSGWEALDASRVLVWNGSSAVLVNRYVLANGDNRALVYYWYQGRGRVAADEYRVKWDLLRDATLRGRTEEALVRIAVPLPSGAAGAGDLLRSDLPADSLARRFASTVIPALERVLPEWPAT